MPEEIKKDIEKEQKKDDNNKEEYKEYIDQINNLKNSTVSKEKYDALEKEKTDLIKALAEGKKINVGEGEKTPAELAKEADEIRKEVYYNLRSEHTNLDYVKKMCRLRECELALGHKDPFVGIDPSNKDYESARVSAQNCYDVYKQCIEESKGDSQIFTALLQSRINQDSPLLTARILKNKK